MEIEGLPGSWVKAKAKRVGASGLVWEITISVKHPNGHSQKEFIEYLWDDDKDGRTVQDIIKPIKGQDDN